MKHFYSLLFLIVSSYVAIGQNAMTINAQLQPDERSITIQQQIAVQNTSTDVWEEVYLTDWAHSFSSKTTPLAKRFAESFEKKFHLAPDNERGFTAVKAISGQGSILQYTRPQGFPDIIKVILKIPVPAGETVILNLQYTVTLPDAKFTDYGITRGGDYNLRYWFMTPSVYDNGWQYYSNKNLNDRYFPQSDITVSFSIPVGFTLVTDLEKSSQGSSYSQGEKLTRLTGKQRTDAKIFLLKNSTYEEVQTDYVTIVSNLQNGTLPPQIRALITDRIAGFLDKNLGAYPFNKILVTDLDYKEQPVYGLNELPSFISPFPDGFKYEIKLLKTTINNYINNTLLVNLREDRWLIDGLKVYMLQKYIDTFYPDLKVVGGLDKYWLVRQFYASKLEFNDQFPILYTHISRLNLDQGLDTPYDKLIKYNKNIGYSYKSGVGLNYLNEYLGDEVLDDVIKIFYEENALKPTRSNNFKTLVRSKSSKDVSWFFDEYITSNERIDYALKNSKVKGDSIYVTVKNKKRRKTPIPVYSFKDDSLTSTRWVSGKERDTTLSYATDNADRFVLNYENIVPENNLRNNYEKPGAFLGIDKPLQFKFFQDFENPSKNQLFFMPVAEFNLYDGFSPGVKLYNKTLLTKALNYKIEPQIGLKSKKLIGSASISYRHDFQNQGLYGLRYGISGNRFSYAPDLLFTRVTPFVNLRFRTSNLRADKRQFVSARYVSVQRQEDPLVPLPTPNYDVLNLRYSRFNPGIIHTLNLMGDVQFARNFGKLSGNIFYRRLFLNNRQLNVRLFGGIFTYNKTQSDGDFFSFALDRPTDYLFDYNYYGRSENSGVFSQQIIIAEGGFKSQLDDVAPVFANEWMFTANASTTLWKYFYAYGDVGVVKNKRANGKLVYDSGIQVSLLDDYFELYFPIYSNLGWEIGQPNYDQKIRFQLQLSVDTVIGLFSRKWY
ncbi:gluzincin family metallopeptidase [Dokdonia donghaensis]|uniref:metalloprotease n=1 Tax=Dokdonia donghaensis TaxID=326320 RepID=UPI001F3783E1|nr:metalloprotease [Dokdonia donghaensis]